MTPPSDACIRVEGVSKRFGSQTALSSCSMRIQKGEAWLLRGANGSGKSTLLRLMAGLLRPDEGAVHLEGRPAREPAARAGLGALMQHATLPPHHTLRRLLAVQGSSQDWLEALNLTPCKERRLGTLSAGQQQRAKLALALNGGARILLLDEPLTALDAQGVEAVQAVLEQKARQGVTVVIASHRTEAWTSFITHEATLETGQVRQAGPVRA